MLRKLTLILALIASLAMRADASYLLLPMDEVSQRNHLKAYGITYWVLSQGVETYWLLNYRGGSFVFLYTPTFEKECKTRDVSYEIIADAQFANIQNEVLNPEINMDVIKLEKAPKIAVYTPDKNEKGELIQPWDDAVTLVLTYAEIPYDVVYDTEVLQDKLAEYDWLHLHHEDFTGQFGKFYANSAGESWYIQQVALLENTARKLGYAKVSELKKAVVQKIRDFVSSGGFMFAMCSATDTYDIALAADGVDICAEIFDGDPMDMQANEKLDYSKCFAFDNFKLVMNPLQYEYSSIDVDATTIIQTESSDYFTLFDFSAKYDPVPTMLTQCHVNVIKGFLGQTTAFHKEQIKKSVLVLAEREGTDQVRYIHGNVGRGTFTWYGGHDPEDYRHAVGDPPTDLKLHPTSPGYRLILNNILFPAAKKKKQKT